MKMDNEGFHKIMVGDEQLTFISPTRTTLGIASVKKSFNNLTSLISPDWIRNSVLYEIYVRNFTEKGNFEGVIDRLPYLKDLGVNTLWLMPIHPIGKKGRKGKKGCPYSIMDYFAINPEYGSEENFKKLVECAHKMEMRLILDLVINHSANDHVMMIERSYWWQRDIDSNPTRRIKDWQDISDFNYQVKDLWNYLVDSIIYWVEKFDIDGYRCDVAGMVPLEFWEYAISQVKCIKPDIFFLAEWEDPNFHLKTFNSTYNWTLYFKLLDVIEQKCNAQEMFDAYLFKHNIFPQNSVQMNFIENHDMKRAANVFGFPQFQPFAGLIFTLPGIPLIYNGQEVGYKSYLSLFERQPLFWKKKNPKIIDYYRDLIKLRKTNVIFQTGTIHKIHSNNPDLVVFYREHTHNLAFCVLNFSNINKKVVLELPDILLAKFQKETWKSFHRLPKFNFKNTKISFEIFSWECIILTN